MISVWNDYYHYSFCLLAVQVSNTVRGFIYEVSPVLINNICRGVYCIKLLILYQVSWEEYRVGRRGRECNGGEGNIEATGKKTSIGKRELEEAISSFLKILRLLRRISSGEEGKGAKFGGKNQFLNL